MKERPVSFDCESLALEGLLAIAPSGVEAPGAGVCHPHPQYGGSMYNNIVEAVLEALWAMGYATLRFNFRGVGSSQGEYGGGRGEVLDVRAAVSFLLGQPGVGRDGALLAGYSFGASVALRAGCEMREVAALVAVAPLAGMMDLSFVAGCGKPVMLVGGDRDPYCPAARLEELRARVGGAASMRAIAGADHFFGGFESQLSAALRELLAGATG